MRDVIAKGEQRKIIEMYKEEFSELRKDINLLGKKDFAVLKTDLERISADVNKMKDGMRDELSKVHAGVRLDINLEKGRVKDEAGLLEQKVVQANSKIHEEGANLKQRLDIIRHEMTQAIVRKCLFIYNYFYWFVTKIFILNLF